VEDSSLLSRETKDEASIMDTPARSTTMKNRYSVGGFSADSISEDEQRQTIETCLYERRYVSQISMGSLPHIRIQIIDNGWKR
jgi:hypothetical protein